MMKKEGRDITVDIAKGLGIFLVVWGHNSIPECPCKSFIYSFHMPLFFFMAGFFLNENESIRVYIYKRIRTLLVPFGFFYCISFPLRVVKHTLGGVFMK